MKQLLFCITFLLFATYGQSQFRLAVNGTPSWTSLGGGLYQTTVTFHADLTGNSYAVSGIVDTMRLFTSRGQIFEVDSVWGKTFSQATLRVEYLEGLNSAPSGQGMVYAPGANGFIPDVPFGSTGATAQFNQMPVTYNSLISVVPPFDSTDIATGGIGNTDLAAGIISTSKIADDAVTLAKQASGTANRLQGFDASGNPSEITVSGIASVSAGNLAVTEVDGSTTNELTEFTASSSAPGSPKQGDLWHDTDGDTVFVRDGGAWVFLAIRSGGGESTTGGSGTTLNGSAIDFGGTLAQNTTINGTFDLRFGNSTKLDTVEIFANKFFVNLNGFKFLRTSGIGGGDVNENLFLGYKAAQNFAGTNGSYANTIIGKGAATLLRDTTFGLALGSSNVIIGYNAAASATYTSFNTVVGTASAGNLTSGQYNTLMGYHVGQNMSNLTGLTLVGAFAGKDATNIITAVGYNSSYNGGPSTTAVGLSAGQNVSGFGLNTFVGQNAGLGGVGSSAYACDAFGIGAGQSLTTGNNNTFIGRNAGNAVTSGTLNVFLGPNAGSAHQTGQSNILIGVGTATTSTSSSQQLNIGNALYGQNIYPTNTNSRFGINVVSPTRNLDILAFDLGINNNETQYPLRLIGQTSTPCTGFGVGMDFVGENGSNANILVARQKATYTDVTASSEDIDLIWDNIVNGSLAERMWLRGSRLGLGAAPVASAALDVNSTAAGFLQPRMTTTQRNAISSPATGLQVYNTSLNKLNFYNGSAWMSLVDSTTLATYLPLAGGTMTGHLLFTDNTYDIGASGATRPRTGYFGTSIVAPIGTFSGDVTVADEAYDATAWNGSLEVPTKNAIRDKLEADKAIDTIYVSITPLALADSLKTVADLANDYFTIPSELNGYKIAKVQYAVFAAGAGTGATVVGLKRYTSTRSVGYSNGYSASFEATDLNETITGSSTVATGDVYVFHVNSHSLVTAATGLTCTLMLTK